MLNKLIVGRWLDIPVGFDQRPAAAPTAGAPEHFMSVANRPYQIEQSSRSWTGTKTSKVSTGTNTKASKSHRNFRWLPYVPGKVTYIPLAGTDILTGLMSGCYIAVARIGGALQVCHIGTADTATDPRTVSVKAAWKAAVASKAVVPVKAFNPAANLNPAGLSGVPEVYGLVTPQQGMHTVVLTKDVKNAASKKRKIEQVYAAAATVVEPPFSR